MKSRVILLTVTRAPCGIIECLLYASKKLGNLQINFVFSGGEAEGDWMMMVVVVMMIHTLFLNIVRF